VSKKMIVGMLLWLSVGVGQTSQSLLSPAVVQFFAGSEVVVKVTAPVIDCLEKPDVRPDGLSVGASCRKWDEVLRATTAWEFTDADSGITYEVSGDRLLMAAKLIGRVKR